MPYNARSCRVLPAARAELMDLPEEIRRAFGYELWAIQCGETPANAKIWRGLGSGVLELVENDADGTYRAVYTVRLAGAIYVLCAFQKKSTQGVATPKRLVELIKARLKQAEEHHAKHG